MPEDNTSAGTEKTVASDGTKNTGTSEGTENTVDSQKLINIGFARGAEAREKQLMRELGITSWDELKASKESASKKGDISADDLNAHPAVVTLRGERDQYKTRAETLENQLREITVTSRIESVAERAGAISAKAARVLFMESHRIELDETGKATVKNLDGVPVIVRDDKGNYVNASVEQAFSDWFANQRDLKKAAPTSGAGAVGNAAGAGPLNLTREQIAKMTPDEYQKYRAQILAKNR